MMAIMELPLGDPPFAKIIGQNLLYAYKTRYIHELFKSPVGNYFLSRPRRFGKTLLLDAIEEFVAGKPSRFKNLWIGKELAAGRGLTDEEFAKLFPRHPVLSLSLSMDSKSPEILESGIVRSLKTIAKAHELVIEDGPPDACLESLITALNEKAGSQVVVLIDEYDAPVTRNMDDLKVARANAKVLHDFFATLKKKAVKAAIRLTMVTGITRYALTSMDSGPNHLFDISLDPRFAGICGFTLEEFDDLFQERFPEALASLKESGGMKPSDDLGDLRREILHRYDGYDWTGPTRVLNPYSILYFIRKNRFDSYWLQSGRPGHLTAMIRANPRAFIAPKLERIFPRRSGKRN
jgi:hypothetical protein